MKTETPKGFLSREVTWSDIDFKRTDLTAQLSEKGAVGSYEWKQIRGNNNNPNERCWGLGTVGEKWSDLKYIMKSIFL